MGVVTMALTLADIDNLTGGRVGTFDVACPWCGPDRRASINQRRKVLRVWRTEPGFASFTCARCGESGYAREGTEAGPRRPPTREQEQARAEVRAEAEAIQRAAKAQRLAVAQRLWLMREPVHGSPVITYLRQVRGYNGRIPDTLGYLPARGEYAPAMIAGFGLAEEPAPGALSLPLHLLTGIHLTKLLPDGSGKAGGVADKVMVGHSAGSPLVLAPMNDLLGLAIIEGIEKGLALHEITGLGVWASCGAKRMPPLAEVVPDFADCVTIRADNDRDGLRYARLLADGLSARRIHAEIRLTVD